MAASFFNHAGVIGKSSFSRLFLLSCVGCFAEMWAHFFCFNALLVGTWLFFSGILFSSGSKMSVFCIQYPSWNKSPIQPPSGEKITSPPPTSAFRCVRSNLFGSKYRILFFVCSLTVVLVRYSTYSLVHYLQHVLNIYLFQPNACSLPPPRKDKWT